MLKKAMFDVAGHSDVEDAPLAGEDVDVVELGHFLSMLVVVAETVTLVTNQKTTVPEWNYPKEMSSGTAAKLS